MVGPYGFAHRACHQLTSLILASSHLGNGQLVCHWCTIENQFDLSRCIISYVNKHVAERVRCLMQVYFFISLIVENQRMSYAVTINIDNKDTRFTRKSKGFLKVLFLPQKNTWFENDVP